MSSSNRQWPSMSKSKPCNPHHHQWQHDHNINPSLISNPTCHRSPFSSSERSPEPKPRWNPKPEQIRILEAIFNSGMVNPPREEIRRIRAQLQEYGQVGDANVFYWFQNRKSRSKHKQRRLLRNNTTKSQPPNLSPPTTTTAAATVPPSSSSSSSDKSSPKSSAGKPFPENIMDGLNSPTASVNQTYFNTPPGEFSPEPFFFPVHQTPATGGITTTSDAAAFTQGFCFPELLSTNNVVHHGSHDQTVGNCSSVLLTDLMMNLGPMNYKKVEDHEKIKLQQLQQQQGYTVTTATINHIRDGAGVSQGKSTVFINDVAFEVALGPFNVREAFGDDAVLINSSGQPVVTNEWGVTLQSLQHGAFYYLI